MVASLDPAGRGQAERGAVRLPRVQKSPLRIIGNRWFTSIIDNHWYDGSPWFMMIDDYVWSHVNIKQLVVAALAASHACRNPRSASLATIGLPASLTTIGLMAVHGS